MRKIKVVGFVGESGTGKSYRAMWVAREQKIEYIIDDGLLIRGNAIVAGKSAKSEKTKIASVRRALFTDKMHAKSVQDALVKSGAESLLILGTSNEMVQAIAKAVGVPAPQEFVNIHDIASDEEVQHARNIRMTEGKHVIPVPTFEVKKQFSGYFIDSLRFLMRDKKNNKIALVDKSIVRPPFSYLGNYEISDRVLVQLAQYEATRTPGVYRVSKISLDESTRGVVLYVDVVLEYGEKLRKVTNQLIQNIMQTIETYTAVNVLRVNVNIRSLHMKRRDKTV